MTTDPAEEFVNAEGPMTQAKAVLQAYVQVRKNHGSLWKCRARGHEFKGINLALRISGKNPDGTIGDKPGDPSSLQSFTTTTRRCSNCGTIDLYATVQAAIGVATDEERPLLEKMVRVEAVVG